MFKKSIVVLSLLLSCLAQAEEKSSFKLLSATRETSRIEEQSIGIFRFEYKFTAAKDMRIAPVTLWGNDEEFHGVRFVVKNGSHEMVNSGRANGFTRIVSGGTQIKRHIHIREGEDVVLETVITYDPDKMFIYYAELVSCHIEPEGGKGKTIKLGWTSEAIVIK